MPILKQLRDPVVKWSAWVETKNQNKTIKLSRSGGEGGGRGLGGSKRGDRGGLGPLNILEGPQAKTFAGRTAFENEHMLTLNTFPHDCPGLHTFVHYLCTLSLIYSFLCLHKETSPPPPPMSKF